MKKNENEKKNEQKMKNIMKKISINFQLNFRKIKFGKIFIDYKKILKFVQRKKYFIQCKKKYFFNEKFVQKLKKNKNKFYKVKK